MIEKKRCRQVEILCAAMRDDGVHVSRSEPSTCENPNLVRLSPESCDAIIPNSPVPSYRLDCERRSTRMLLEDILTQAFF